MKKTVILSTGGNGQPIILEQVMRGALSSGFTVSKSSLIFESKKEAEETIKNHPCGKGYKCYTLTDTQVKILDLIKNSKKSQYIRLCDFLKLK